MSTFASGSYAMKKGDVEYYHYVYKMMFTLAKRCSKAITGGMNAVDHQKFAACVGKLFGVIIKLEEERQQQLRFSESLFELTQLLGLQGTNLKMNEETNEHFHINQPKLKIQIHSQVRRLEPQKYMPQKVVSKSIDHSFVKLTSKTRPESEIRDIKEARDNLENREIKEVSLNIPKNSFFQPRRSTEASNIKTLEQKEREFLEKFKRQDEY